MDKITVSGGNLEYGYRDISDQGAGWTAANSLFWQGRASQTHCVTPPTALMVCGLSLTATDIISYPIHS